MLFALGFGGSRTNFWAMVGVIEDLEPWSNLPTSNFLKRALVHFAKMMNQMWSFALYVSLHSC